MKTARPEVEWLPVLYKLVVVYIKEWRAGSRRRWSGGGRWRRRRGGSWPSATCGVRSRANDATCLADPAPRVLRRMITPLENLARRSGVAACLPARVDILCLGHTRQPIHLLAVKINRERRIRAALSMACDQASCKDCPSHAKRVVNYVYRIRQRL
jgi:hypothetical protein